MRRRTFLRALAASTAWPFAARAVAKPVIGFLHAAAPEENQKRVAAFLKGLVAGGFVDGQNVAIDYRWAMGLSEKLPEMAADLVRAHVAVIATPGSTAATVAAKNATKTIPLVFSSGTDPVDLGGLNRPGGNVTGITSLNAELAGKKGSGCFANWRPRLRAISRW
jgi:putative ABC transport system substrate-binding protein